MTLHYIPRVLCCDFPIRVFQGLHTAFLSTVDTSHTVGFAKSYDSSGRTACPKAKIGWRTSQNRQDSEWPNQRTRTVFPNVFNVTSRIERGTSIMSLTWYRRYKKKISYPWQLVGTVLALPMSSRASNTSPVCQMPAVVTSLLPTSNGVLITVWSVSEPIPQCQLSFCFLGSLLWLTLFT